MIKILLVEDSIEDVKFVSILLRQSFPNEHSLYTTDYFSKATSLVLENPFDVIILDLSLPDSRGLNTLRELIDSCSIPIIIYTGLTDELIKAEAFKCGASDYLIKGQTTAVGFKESILASLDRVEWK